MRPRRPLRLILIGFCHLATLTALLTLCAWCIGRVMSDRGVWSQWLSWIPTPTLLIAVMLGLLGTLAIKHARRRKRWRRLWLGVAVAACLWFGLIDHRWLRFPKASETGVSLVHWHLGFAREGVDQQRIIEQALTMVADVTILVDGYDVRTRIIRGLPETHTGHTYGRLTILSRLPLRDLRTIVNINEQQIILIEFEPPFEDGRPLVVYAIDLPSDPNLSRMQVARGLRARLDGLSPAPPAADVVVGDFNIQRGSASLKRLFPDLHHAFDDGGHGYGASFPRSFPLVHIDHALLAHDLHCSRYDLSDPGFGRHLAQRLVVERH